MATLDFKGSQNSQTICIFETYSLTEKLFVSNSNANLMFSETEKPTGSVVNLPRITSSFHHGIPWRPLVLYLGLAGPLTRLVPVASPTLTV